MTIVTNYNFELEKETAMKFCQLYNKRASIFVIKIHHDLDPIKNGYRWHFYVPLVKLALDGHMLFMPTQNECDELVPEVSAVVGKKTCPPYISKFL